MLRNARQLKGSKVSVAEDLIYEKHQKNKALRKHLREARANKLNVYIKVNKIYMNGESVTTYQLNDKESEDADVEQRPNRAPATPNVCASDTESVVSSYYVEVAGECCSNLTRSASSK